VISLLVWRKSEVEIGQDFEINRDGTRRRRLGFFGRIFNQERSVSKWVYNNVLSLRIYFGKYDDDNVDGVEL